MGYSVERGYEGTGDYGFDTIALSDQIGVPSQIVGIINDTATLIGSLGLGVKQTNFSSEQKLSFLGTLRNQSLIPSRSYGLTAGAFYRLSSTCFIQVLPMSLTAF